MIASVSGKTGSYRVEFAWDGADGAIRGRCSCPYFANGAGGMCKHLWATLLTIDARGWPDSLRQLAQRGPLHLGHDGVGAVMKVGDTGNGATQPRRKPRPKRPQRGTDWPAVLARAHGRHSDAESSSDQRPGPQQAWYLIDHDASASAGSLIIRHAYRKRKKRGEWGRLVFERLARDSLARYRDTVDRELLELLLALREGDARSYAMPSHGAQPPSILRTAIDPPLYELLLSRLAATGRLGYLAPGAQAADAERPIAWDGDGQWGFDVTFDDSAQAWEMSGWLRGGKTPIPLHTVQLLIDAGLFLHQNVLARVDLAGCAGCAQILHATPAVAIPHKDKERFLDAWWSAPRRPPAALPPALRLRRSEAAPRGHVAVNSRTRERRDRDVVHAAVSFDYAGRRVEPRADATPTVDLAQNTVHIRDARREQGLLSEFREAGFRSVNRGDAQWEIKLPALVPALTKLCEGGWLVEVNRSPLRFSSDVALSISSSTDWFDLTATVDFDGELVELPRLLRAAADEPLIELADGARGVIPAATVAELQRLAALGTMIGNALRFRSSQALMIDTLLDAQALKVDYDSEFLALRKRLRSFDGIKPARQPHTFEGEMRPYQLEGLAWLRGLYALGMGGCLADDMGLGKTIQVLALLDDLRERSKELETTLIVVPKSLVFNWIDEAARFAPRLRLLEYTGHARKALLESVDEYDIVITTYGTVRRDVETLSECAFSYVVLDEAQAIKNPQSQAAKAVRTLQARHRLVMTGTPVENHLGDLGSLFEFVNPGLLGRSRGLVAADRDRNDLATAEALGAGVRPFILRRTKEQVLADLPPKLEQTIVCELARPQRKLYDELREHYRKELTTKIGTLGTKRSKIHVLEALLRLRQAACHPGLIDPERAADDSAKLETLTEQIREVIAGGHKALVFSQFTRFLNIVRSAFDAAEITYEYLDGKTRNRAQRIAHFQDDPSCPVFLISLKAGGFGLNLTAADYVFILDPWWNPAVESQAVDRAHRIGQERPVFAYRLISADTVEEKILTLQASKRELADAIVGENNRLIGNLTAEHLELLLS